MNSSALQRILGSPRQAPLIIEESKSKEEFKIPVDNSPIIEPEILRSEILKKLNPQPQIKLSSEKEAKVLELVHFASLFEFVHWYENNKNIFSENQKKPLDTLIEAKNITLGGCNCDKGKRKLIAEDYFRKFWINNKKTDLLPTLQKILNTKKIVFGNFLSFPE